MPLQHYDDNIITEQNVSQLKLLRLKSLTVFCELDMINMFANLKRGKHWQENWALYDLWRK